jgi:predicted secreted protein
LGAAFLSAQWIKGCCAEPTLAQAEIGNADSDKDRIVLDENITGVAHASLNEHVDVRLKALLGAGYSWSLEGLRGEAVKLLDTKVEENDTKQLGVGGQSNWQVFSFEAVKIGTVELRFLYHRPWEKPAETDRRLSFTLIVQERK